MSEGENLDPLPYFTAAEENFLVFHEDDLIEGDIRLWLKEKEKEQMLEKWRSLKVQEDWFGGSQNKSLIWENLPGNGLSSASMDGLGFISSSSYVTGFQRTSEELITQI